MKNAKQIKNTLKTYTVAVAGFDITVTARTQKEANYKAKRKVDAMLRFEKALDELGHY